MTQELTPEAARARLETIRRVLLLVAVVYLALHIWVSYRALVDSGVLTGIATLLTLGFGDLYWAVYGADGSLRQPALVAGVMAFASWLSRPWSTAYLMKLGLQSIDWPKAGDECADDAYVADDAEKQRGEGVAGDTTVVGGAGSTGPIGGAGSTRARGGVGEEA